MLLFFLFLLLLTLAASLLGYRLLSEAGPPEIPTATITENLEVDWAGTQPDFDPWNRCPDDFFQKGFVLLQKRMPDGHTIKFLLHRGKKLLYRIDQDVIRGIPRIGLHWVTGTKFGAKYRLADPKFVGGKAVARPTGTTSSTTATYHYGQAVGKRQTAPGREFFHATHIPTDNCPDWFNLFNFTP